MKLGDVPRARGSATGRVQLKTLPDQRRSAASPTSVPRGAARLAPIPNRNQHANETKMRPETVRGLGDWGIGDWEIRRLVDLGNWGIRGDLGRLGIGRLGDWEIVL